MILLLLAGTQAVTYFLVSRVAERAARERISEDLHDAAGTFEILLKTEAENFSRFVELLTSDYAFASTFAQLEEADTAVARATLRSALQNFRDRIGRPAFLRLVSLDRELLADTEASDVAAVPAMNPAIFDAAEESPGLEAAAIEIVGDRMGLLVVHPLLAPDPAAWVVVGFPLDDRLAAEFRRLSGFEVSFLGGGRVMASTFDSERQRDLAAALPTLPDGEFVKMVLVGETFLGRTIPMPGDARGEATILVLRSLDRELAPFHQLERIILGITVVALLLAAVVGFFVARSLARPAVRLVEGVQKIERGDFRTRVPVETRDELGRLAGAFNQMAAGLQERDKVRDILGKVVSPEVARELMTSATELGGELHNASILFTDLRGFTPFSESQNPQDLVTQLNAYFTEITEAIESCGGVVDKYIGDAVMAVFGAPVKVTDHADRALDAARAILAAEVGLNLGRAAAGLPPFQTGIGISTGVIVAGNIGSATRHNYTVIGNEVNLASRLESLTKTLEFHTRIICSDATRAALQRPHSLRDLGETSVRGKAGTIRIWAVE